jgi:organic radical activating enzyme
LDGTIHLIWTGGEPAMKKHQEAIENFFIYWSQCESDEQGLLKVDFLPYSEIETNGTVEFSQGMFFQLDQINCSPKLENSGMTAKQRIKPEVIQQIMKHDNYQFKFVISTEDDVKEVFRDFVEPFNIPLKNVVCMPGLDDQADFHERTQFVLEMAKKYKFTGLTRLHISAWDKTLNV